MSPEFSFSLSFDDFDLSLLGDTGLDRNTAAFATKVSEFFVHQFQGFGGKARVIIRDQDRVIEVRWTKESQWREPKDKILELLQCGELAEALPMIWTLVQQDSQDEDNLYHLGVVYSELRQYAKASEVLGRLIEIAPHHVHGVTALGVAEIASGNLLIAEEWLTKAVRLQPNNRWALRNLGACLMKQNRFQEASQVLRCCLQEAPTDVAAMVGLGESLEALGEADEAEQLYKTAVKLPGPDHVIDLVKERLTKIAAGKFRADSAFRPDAVAYINDALERFAKLTPKQIQDLGFEIAMLGRKGFSINDPSKKYTVKGLAGEFTALHLVSIMYAAFQQFAPGQDVGLDLSKEYAAAMMQRQA